jgi:hypothetical protein
MKSLAGNLKSLSAAALGRKCAYVRVSRKLEGVAFRR